MKNRSHVKLIGMERQVIELMCRGVAPKELSTRLTRQKFHERGELNRRSVHYYLRRVKDKLGARTTWQACAIYGALHPELVDEIHPSVIDTPYPATRGNGEIRE